MPLIHSDSSDKSSMWEEKSGSPWALKKACRFKLRPPLKSVRSERIWCSNILTAEEFATLLGYQISAFWSPGMVELLPLLCCAVHFNLQNQLEMIWRNIAEWQGRLHEDSTTNQTQVLSQDAWTTNITENRKEHKGTIDLFILLWQVLWCGLRRSHLVGFQHAIEPGQQLLCAVVWVHEDLRALSQRLDMIGHLSSLTSLTIVQDHPIARNPGAVKESTVQKTTSNWTKDNNTPLYLCQWRKSNEHQWTKPKYHISNCLQDPIRGENLGSPAGTP